MRCKVVPTVIMTAVLTFQTGPSLAPAQGPAGMRQAEHPRAALGAPVTAEPVDPAKLEPAKLDETDRLLPINLALFLTQGPCQTVYRRLVCRGSAGNLAVRDEHNEFRFKVGRLGT
jgi:hypothetical protein